MMLLPVQIASGRARKPNSWVLQRIHSSAQPARCSAIIVRTKTNSSTKSRSLETSRLLAATPSKPSSLATNSRSIGRLVPARAAAPSGSTFSRLRQSASRDCGRARASRRRPGSSAAPAPAGPAACACSRAGSRRGAAPPPPRAPAAGRSSAASTRSRASRIQSFSVGGDLVVAAPRGVQLAARRRPASRSAPPRCACGRLRAPGRTRNRPASISAWISDKPRTICWHSSAVSRPTCCEHPAWAIEPRMSCLKSRRSKEIDSVNSSTRRSV